MDASNFESVLLEIGRGAFERVSVVKDMAVTMSYVLSDGVARSMPLTEDEAAMVARVVNGLNNGDLCRVRPFTSDAVGYVAVRITHDLHRRRW